MLTKMEHSPILPSPPALQGYWALSKCCTDIGQHSHSLGGEWRQQQSVLRALDGGSDLVFKYWVCRLLQHTLDTLFKLS